MTKLHFHKYSLQGLYLQGSARAGKPKVSMDCSDGEGAGIGMYAEGSGIMGGVGEGGGIWIGSCMDSHGGEVMKSADEVPDAATD
jgi:hypothetical protein